ncbi:PREDICTED: LRR receptor-like serine/threonine-protein kinase GSO1-like [Fragaria vesca subsp. vesca]
MSGGSMQYSVLVGLVCLAIASFSSSVGSSNNTFLCLESERLALLQFKQGLLSDYKYNALATWESTKDCCDWRGIACNNHTGHVITLDLSFNFLRGEIHPSLLELRYLEYLDLSFNDFGGMMIPVFIGSLSQLKELKLGRANFSGHVPPQLGNLSNLHTLDLSNNENVSSENVEWLSHLSSLRYLNMSWVNLSEAVNWPQSLSKLTSLRELKLSLCNLPDVNLSSLSKNALETLDLQNNQFWGSLPELTGFSKLRELLLSSNNISGSLPESVGTLSSLEELDVSMNSMTGVITESHLRDLSRLQSLKLSGNGFYINLSSHWDPPFQLTSSLALSSCKLGPAFPKWILKQTNITELHLSNAGISGSLPDKFWDLFVHLYSLDLSINQICGKLPNLSTTIFWVVDLSSNLLSGAVPSFPPTLRFLNLSTNMFSDLSSSFCATRAPYLGFIEISDNLLSGELPNCWMQFSGLGLLFLGKNKLSGKIPSSLGNLKIMTLLSLKDNNFSGELPSLENCTELAMVDLDNNNLSGRIPTWIGQRLTTLMYLRLRSNQFSGIIPSSLCNLATIHVLDLSHNNISGGLPRCLNNITAMAVDIVLGMGVELVWKGIEREFGKNLLQVRSIDISSNSLVDEIPESITSMEKLTSLNLSGNNLIGKVPENFGNMKMLESLDLSRNQISGGIPASFSKLNFLSVLDLSHNNLSGRIPLGTQLQSFNATVYMGNFGLCGPPLTPNCSENGTTQADDDMKEDDDDGLISLGFFISTVLGFVSGFWIVCGSLLLKSSWRYAYFKFLDDSRDWIHVKTAVYKEKMQRRLQR